MRNVGVVLAQVVVALLLAGLIAPAILAAIPALTEHGSGMWAILVLVLVIFVLVRLVWPRRKT